MQGKIVSAIVLSYKQFQYIYETIDSVMIQDYPAVELIVADDGSPEFPDNELKKYIDEHKRKNLIRYELIHGEVNIGTVKNINRAIKHSTGDYIKIVAGDDAFYDEKVFSKQVDFLNNNPEVMIVTGKTCECDEAMNPIYKEQVENTNKEIMRIFKLEPKDYFIECGKKHLFPMVTQALCFRKEFFDKYGLYDERYRLVEDPPMEKRIIINRVPVGAVDEYVVRHRADVGISANNELFSTRRQQYYLDLMNYVKNDLMSHPELFSPFKTKWKYRTEKFRYEMSVTTDKRQKIKLIFRNLDTAFWFVILNPDRAIHKIKLLVAKRKT